MDRKQAALAIQVLPKTKNEAELIRVVDCVIENIEQKGLNYSVGAFETTIDGDLDTLLDIIKESVEICIREGAPSVMSYIKLHYNPSEGVLSIEQKTDKYQQHN